MTIQHYCSTVWRHSLLTVSTGRLASETCSSSQLVHAAEAGGATAVTANKSIVSTAAGLPGELMYEILVEQNINCRTIGRCTFGSRLDREMLDLVPREFEADGITSRRERAPYSTYDRSRAPLSVCSLQC